MRIGVLTLHDSVNYGAVLQAHALCSHLKSLGHQAIVLDRRRMPDLSLRVPSVRPGGYRLLGLWPVRAYDGIEEACCRVERTERFLKERVGLSSFRFHDWADAPADLGIDLMIVGSDQVWNAGNLNPEDYLLPSVCGNVPGIAYAASIGMPEFPEDQVEVFRRGFRRFRAIGVREREAADMVRALGAEATQVVDPVLLGGREVWNALPCPKDNHSAKVFAYFLAEDFDALFKPLGDFARARQTRVNFYVDWLCRRRTNRLGRWLRNRRWMRRIARIGVDLRLDAGPAEFVRDLAAADVVVSNSYHALMFSLLFGKEVRIVLPSHPVRQKMNARLREFEDMVTGGPLVVPDISAALESLDSNVHVAVRQDCLAARIDASRKWLGTALKECAGGST